jgi:hypothetical protein
VTPEEVFRQLVTSSREAGTLAAREARTLLARHLEARGFTVREQPFTFQPMAANVLPLIGAGLGWLTLLLLPLLLFENLPPFLALLVWVAGLLAVGILAWGIGSGVAVPGAERRLDANLIATRGRRPVRRWIVAHVDSKAQGQSMAGRLVAVWVLVTALAGLSVLAVVRWTGGTALPAPPVAAAAGAALTAGILAVRGRLKGESPGARDNGTGLLAALGAAESLEEGTGIVLTGAEEFGLVGSRALLDEGGIPPGSEVLNLDTITGRGRLYVLFHDASGRALALRLAPLLAGSGGPVRVRRLPLGILVDSLPLARAGATAVTIARLDWSDLRRLHTPRDTAEDLDLGTAHAVGHVLLKLR